MPDEKSDHDMIIEMYTEMVGLDGRGGLCHMVAKHEKAIFKMWIFLIVLALSVGGGTWGIVRAILVGGS